MKRMILLITLTALAAGADGRMLTPDVQSREPRARLESDTFVARYEKTP
jgi:hypothetical protein